MTGVTSGPGLIDAWSSRTRPSPSPHRRHPGPGHHRPGHRCRHHHQQRL